LTAKHEPPAGTGIQAPQLGGTPEPEAAGHAQAASSHADPRGEADPSSLEDLLRAARTVALQPTRRNLVHWTSWALALGVELALVVVLRNGQIYDWELSITRTLQDVPRRRIVFDVSSTLTNTISVPFLLIFLAIVGLVLRHGHRIDAAVLALTLPLHVCAQFPKALVDRPRPSAAFSEITGVGGHQSFPSGHAEYVVTFYGFLAYLLIRRVRHRGWRFAIAGAWLILTLATGFGRVAAGRHWPIDVLASYVIGLGLLSGLIWLHTALIRAEEEIQHASAACIEDP
jgi:undecaprenyl-diphosphatase